MLPQYDHIYPKQTPLAKANRGWDKTNQGHSGQGAVEQTPIKKRLRPRWGFFCEVGSAVLLGGMQLVKKYQHVESVTHSNCLFL